MGSKSIIFILFVLPILVATSCKKKGCMDPIAINYNPSAQKPDVCTYSSISIDCGNGGIFGDRVFMDIPENEIDYIISCDAAFIDDVVIEPGVTFYVADGVTIRFWGDVKMNGTSNKPIRFVPQDNSWKGIRVEGSDGNCSMSHVLISGIHNSFVGTLSTSDSHFGFYYDVVVGKSLLIDHLTIENCSQGGMFLDNYLSYNNDDNVTISSLTIKNCDTPIRLNGYALLDDLGTLNCFDNTNNEIYISAHAAGSSGDLYFPNTGLPIYLSTENLTNENMYPSSEIGRAHV